MDSRKRALDLKLPAFPEPATLPRIPSYESIISSNFEDDELKPNAMRTSLEKPLFIKVDKYEKVVSSINMIKQKLNEARAILNDVRAIKEEEDAKIQQWHDDLERIKENLLNVDNILGESLK